MAAEQAVYNVRLKTRALVGLPVDEDADEVSFLFFALAVTMGAFLADFMPFYAGNDVVA